MALLAAGRTGGAQTVSGRARQTEAGSPELRGRCARAAAVLLSDTADRADSWHYDTIGQCERSGPAALAHAWGVVGGDKPDQLRALVASSWEFLDRRLFTAEQRALASRRPDAVRRAAIDVLFGYAASGDGYPTLTRGLGPPDAPPHAYISRWGTRPDPIVGQQPVTGDIPRRVQRLLQRVSGGRWSVVHGSNGMRRHPNVGPSDTSTVAGHAALGAEVLSSIIEDEVATPHPGAVVLTAVCGTRFRLTSRHVRGLQLVYTVNDSGPRTEVGVAARGHTVFTVRAAGTVRVSTYLGESLATAQSSARACPP